MTKLILLGGAAMLALSGAAFAQSAGSEPAPDTATASPPRAESSAPADTAAAAPAAPDAAPAASVAQSTAPAADAAATTPSTPAATASTEGTAATTATAAAPAAPTATADAAAKVNADWAKYDEGNKGKLTALEFGTWLLAAKGQDMTAQVEKTKTSKKSNLPAVKVLNATASDFAKADTDKDRAISPNELAVFLSA
ncbi:hypothetical protein [Rhizorhabdus dicambivorans]|uniref:Calcium-binding protein n=1 Tax=Rhizorhabdus dicambivorans TaxID=1850238 RepID=A0A2A4FV63_9SPHN|nr:hypothetical protein [Rhizorhabdus dicambivorans]ATE66128.1 hypothetical protein CMV14_18395 [Rhizorhabdus dicambivorans]PCE42054.1 hypothetical protein COO09_12100 [Rhizorhabdus dicambivorans]